LVARKRTSVEVRFWKFVDKTSDCWIWTGAKTLNGYGTIGLGSKKDGKEMSHRLSYKIHKGEIPDGMYILHSCDNPSCVNPDHLRFGTAKENTHDAMDKNRFIKPPIHVGENNPKAKITAEQAREIRDNNHIKAKYYAEKYSLHISTVLRIRRGRTWKDA